MMSSENFWHVVPMELGLSSEWQLYEESFCMTPDAQHWWSWAYLPAMNKYCVIIDGQVEEVFERKENDFDLEELDELDSFGDPKQRAQSLEKYLKEQHTSPKANDILVSDDGERKAFVWRREYDSTLLYLDGQQIRVHGRLWAFGFAADFFFASTFFHSGGLSDAELWLERVSYGFDAKRVLASPNKKRFAALGSIPHARASSSERQTRATVLLDGEFLPRFSCPYPLLSKVQTSIGGLKTTAEPDPWKFWWTPDSSSILFAGLEVDRREEGQEEDETEEIIEIQGHSQRFIFHPFIGISRGAPELIKIPEVTLLDGCMHPNGVFEAIVAEGGKYGYTPCSLARLKVDLNKIS